MEQLPDIFAFAPGIAGMIATVFVLTKHQEKRDDRFARALENIETANRDLWSRHAAALERNTEAMGRVDSTMSRMQRMLDRHGAPHTDERR